MIYNNNCKDNQKLPDNWDDIFKNRRELPPEEFQFSIGKQWKNSTDRSEGDEKVNNNSPSDRLEGDHKLNNNSSSDCSEVDRKINNNSPSDQTEGAKYFPFRQMYPLRGSKSELAVDKTTTPVLLWLKGEIITMMNIMY